MQFFREIRLFFVSLLCASSCAQSQVSINGLTAQLNAMIGATQEHKAQLQQGIVSGQAQMDAEQTALAAILQQMGSVQGTINSYAMSIRNDESYISSLRSQIPSLNQQISSANLTVQDDHSAVNAAQQHVTDIQNQGGDPSYAEAELAAAQSQLATDRAHLSSLQNHLYNVNSHISNTQSEITRNQQLQSQAEESLALVQANAVQGEALIALLTAEIQAQQQACATDDEVLNVLNQILVFFGQLSRAIRADFSLAQLEDLALQLTAQKNALQAQLPSLPGGDYSLTVSFIQQLQLLITAINQYMMGTPNAMCFCTILLNLSQQGASTLPLAQTLYLHASPAQRACLCNIAPAYGAQIITGLAGQLAPIVPFCSCDSSLVDLVTTIVLLASDNNVISADDFIEAMVNQLVLLGPDCCALLPHIITNLVKASVSVDKLVVLLEAIQDLMLVPAYITVCDQTVCAWVTAMIQDPLLGSTVASQLLAQIFAQPYTADLAAYLVETLCGCSAQDMSTVLTDALVYQAENYPGSSLPTLF